MNIGQRIRHYRKKAGISSRELGEMTNVTSQCILQFERGERNVNMLMITKIAKALNIYEQDLFTPVYLSLGERIAKYRKLKGLTQNELAQKIGKTESTVRKYESGYCEPPLRMINILADTLEISVGDLISRCTQEEIFHTKQRRINMGVEEVELHIQAMTNNLIQDKTCYNIKTKKEFQDIREAHSCIKEELEELREALIDLEIEERNIWKLIREDADEDEILLRLENLDNLAYKTVEESLDSITVIRKTIIQRRQEKAPTDGNQ